MSPMKGWSYAVRRSILLHSLAVILLSAAAFADGTYETEGMKGFKAYESGDYATALKEFLPLAKKGQVSAEAAVGQMYFEGKGVAPDPAEAAKWLEPAAKAGN